MQHYELLYIVPVKYEEQVIKETQEKVKELIEKAEGKITKEDTLGILRLAYPIKSINQGHYFLMEFDLEDSTPLKKINYELRMMNEVLRSQIVKKVLESEKQMESVLLKERKEKLDEQRGEESKKEEKKEEKKPEKEEKKVNIKELDEKLDKILDSDII